MPNTDFIFTREIRQNIYRNIVDVAKRSESIVYRNDFSNTTYYDDNTSSSAFSFDFAHYVDETDDSYKCAYLKLSFVNYKNVVRVVFRYLNQSESVKQNRVIYDDVFVFKFDTLNEFHENFSTLLKDCFRVIFDDFDLEHHFLSEKFREHFQKQFSFYDSLKFDYTDNTYKFFNNMRNDFRKDDRFDTFFDRSK